MELIGLRNKEHYRKSITKEPGNVAKELVGLRKSRANKDNKSVFKE
jgi:hypothetical protein